MQSTSMRLNHTLALLLGGLLIAASCIGGSVPAQAFGLFGFGRGGFIRPIGPRFGSPLGPPPGRHLPPPRFGGGGYPGKPPGWSGPSRGPIVGGGVVVGGAVGGGAVVSGGQSGGGHSGNHGGGNGGGSSGGGNSSGGKSAGSGGNNAGSGNASNNGRGTATATQGDQPYVPNEVIIAFAPNTPAQAIDQFARRYDLTQVETQSFALIGSSLYRWRIGGSRTVASVINAAGSENVVASVQPNYLFVLQDAAAAITRGDASQYVLRELQIDQAHQIATGKDVLVAVIDSEIDTKHPDLGGTVAKSFDALGGGEAPHLHGTEMAGAIGAHGKLLGIAPDAQILAAHAFDDSAGIAKGTSFAIYKGLQWAADNSARVVNMSFAGPADPTLHRMLAAASDKGIVLIAAAGNAGPQAEPLYPAADPNVIAVTATDSDDHIFKMAVRGRHIAVAAPGVDIIALAPGGSYEVATGTSIAAAHVSGIAALLLERKPSLAPSDIRAILIATAKLPGAPAPDSEFGAGLVSAYRALVSLDHSTPGGKDENAQAKQ
jgi:subtilisin family serine protease